MFTEAWAAAYFQSLIMILIFVLGVPSLLLQVVAPTVELYRLIQRRFRISMRAYFVVFLAIGMTLFFAWQMHPTGSGWPEPALRYANGLISFVILLAGGAWAYYFHSFTRAGIIHRIKKAIVVSHSRRGHVHEEAERNLGFLGEVSRAGREKEEILRVFGEVFEIIIADRNYDGTRLLLLVEGVKRTLLASGHFGNERNFRQGARILEEARKLIREYHLGALSTASDLLWIDEGIAAVALFAASKGFKVCHELLDNLNPGRLLEVGVVAWRAGEVTIYTNAVGKLRSRYSDAQAGNEEVGALVVSLLALLAHLASGGHAARRWSEERLAALREDLGEPEFKRHLEQAHEECYHMGDFDSADALHVLRSRF